MTSRVHGDDDFYEEDYRSASRKLNEKIVLRDLLEKGEVEFSLDANEDNEFEEHKVEEAYKFEEYEHLINLDCIGVSENTDKLPFEILEEKMTLITTDGGVKKLIKTKGSGIKVPENAFVYLHYSCFLEFEEVPFDSSCLRSSKPSKFQVGTGKLFPGLDIGVSSMQEGEKAYILVKPDYAFKEMGVPPRIPKNATILIDVHLTKVVDCGSVVEVADDLETMRKSFPAVTKKAKSYMELGKDCFSNKNYGQAADSYRKAVMILTGCELANDEEEELFTKLILKAYTNLTICYNGLHQYKRVCAMARDANSENPILVRANARLQYNWAKALKNLGEYKAAADHLKLAKAACSSNLEIDKLLKEVEELKKTQNKEQRILFSKALGLNPSVSTKENKAKEEDPFVEQMRTDLKKFAESKNSRFELPEGLVSKEVDAVRAICDELQLKFREFKIGDDVKMSILK